MMRLALLLTLLLALGLPVRAEEFAAIAERARGQTVYFNAWGGSRQINDYLAWAGQELQRRFGVTLVQVKLTDTGEAVARVAAEKAAGRTEGGTVDLIWLNGENFAAMKEQGLLYGPFTQLLPSFALVDTQGQPTTLVDFTIPTDGLESPWGMAKFVLFHDTARVSEPPASLDELLAWAEANPGRFTYPAPPDFIGSTFLKHVLHAAVPDPARLQRPVGRGRVRRLDRGRLGAARPASPASLARRPGLPRHRPGAAPAAGRWRGRLLDGVQPGRGVEPDPGRPPARHRAQLRLRRRDHRQHAFPGDPVQRRASRRGASSPRSSCSRPRPRPASRTSRSGAIPPCSTSPP